MRSISSRVIRSDCSVGIDYDFEDYRDGGYCLINWMDEYYDRDREMFVLRRSAPNN